MSACPTCGKPVDALRARHVAVRAGKVTAYCSPECLASADPSKPNVAPPRSTPAEGIVKTGATPDSGPVIEIRYEPASGVVTSAPDTRNTPEPRTLDALAERKPEAKQPEPTPAKPAENKVEPAKPAKPAENKVEPAKLARAASEPKPESKKPEPKPESKKPEPKPESKKPEPKPEPKKPEAKVEPPKPKDEPKPKLDEKKSKRLEVVLQTGSALPELPPGAEQAKLSPAKISETAVQDSPAALGPRRPGRETMKRDVANADLADDWIDDEPADEGVVRATTDVSELEIKRGGRGVMITLIVVLFLAAGVVVAYKVFGKGSTGTRTQPGSGSVGAASGTGSAPGVASGSGSNGLGSNKRVVGPPVDTEKPDAKQPSDRLDRAIAILRRHLDDRDSPRVQRVAAAALSRTGDKAAIERLATALAKDKLEPAGQLDVAYALARAGDKRGEAVLVAAIAAPRRDDKLAAGRLLLQLNNKRGADILAAYLEVPQHRLGAAELLARISEPRGIKVLEAVRADKAASADDKARAVIGLGLAGKPEVTEEVRALLTDNRFNVHAAEALAIRHDETARPILVKQLELSSLRVGAARALRLLAPDAVPAGYLDTLTAALDDPNQQRDTEQIAVAEAILLLAGPATWAERT